LFLRRSILSFSESIFSIGGRILPGSDDGSDSGRSSNASDLRTIAFVPRPIAFDIEQTRFPATNRVCPSTNRVCPSTKRVCPSTKRVCPSTKRVCPSTKRVCPRTIAFDVEQTRFPSVKTA
jgi:hypothetical protein